MTGRRTAVALTVVCLLLALGAGVGAAPADADVQAWAISSASSPTSFRAGDETGDDTYVLTVVDNGVGSATSGSPIEITDALPSGLTASGISGEDLGSGRVLTCRLAPTLGCSYEGFEMAPGDVLQIKLAVKVAPGVASSVVNSATVAGGGAAVAASAEDPTTISSMSAGFGASSFAVGWSGTQAGASVNLIAGFTLNQLVSGGETIPAADPKEVALSLPPGFVTNTSTTSACSSVEAAKGACPAAAAVGVAFASTASGEGGAPAPYSSLVYNVTPSPGEIGALVLFLPSGPVWLGLTLRTNGGDQLRLAAPNLPQVDPLISMTLTLWGVPAADNGSGAGPDHVIAGGSPSFGSPGGPAKRFLTSAGTCDGAEPASTLAADSWVAPSVFDEASSTSAALTGCNSLPFNPSLRVASDVAEAETPSGYEVDLDVPQPEAAEGLASAELKEAAVTLPEGADLSLSAADGLQACTEAQIALDSTAPATCPDAAKVGRVAIRAPLLANPLEGAMYLAAPQENPFGSSLALYIVAEEPLSGVRVKLAAQLEPNPVTGQLTIVLHELPQIPVSALEMHFFGGARALLGTPPVCGAFTGTSDLTPWSEDTSVIASSTFEIGQGLNGAPCSDLRAFSPAFQAGSAAAGEADAYQSLTFLVTRAEGEAELGAIAIQVPAPVAQMLAGVPTCEEPEALQGACPAASEVGTVTARAGLGYAATELSGDVYLTGPYGGGAQGLEIVLPVDPGPFELGTLVVRASAQTDPATRRLTIATDRLPSVVDGVPLHLGAILLQLDRGEFRISPDGCEPLTVTGTISSAQGSSVTIATEPLGVSSSPCPSRPASIPAATGGASPTATVSLVGAHIPTRRNGRVAIELRCMGTATCHGTLTLTVKSPTRKRGKRRFKTMTIGTATFFSAAGATATIQFELNATGRALLSADHGRLNARLTILKTSPAPSQTHTEKVQLVRQKTHGKARGRGIS
jgi:hypothetical protein